MFIGIKKLTFIQVCRLHYFTMFTFYISAYYLYRIDFERNTLAIAGGGDFDCLRSRQVRATQVLSILHHLHSHTDHDWVAIGATPPHLTAQHKYRVSRILCVIICLNYIVQCRFSVVEFIRAAYIFI